MHTSAIAIWAIVIVAVVTLAIWLVGVSRAARKPYQDPHGGQLRGPVTGGTHVGGGRSVAPRRDEEVNPDQTAYGDTVSPRLDPPEPEHAPPDSASSRDQ
jgi:hypothetical protein